MVSLEPMAQEKPRPLKLWSAFMILRVAVLKFADIP